MDGGLKMANLSDKYKNNLPFESSNITTITSNYTALNNDVIFANTASSALVVTLPASPTAGSKIKVLDIAANSQNNNITILGNGRSIGGASSYIINTPDSSSEFLFINSIKGWNVSGEYVSITKPQSPLSISAVDVGTGRAYNNGAATVSFVPSTEGDSATSYTVTSTPGSYSATGTSSPIVVTGLQSNTSYTFKVFATNAAGNSTESIASSSITATTVPQAPLIGTATNIGTGRAYNNGAATIGITPQATGGSSITSYNVTSNIGGYTGTGSSSPITATGLQSNSSYTFTATATNANGTSISSSSSNSITATTVPQAPTISSVTHGFEHVSIAFTENATGGSSITGFTVTSNPGSATANGSTSPLKVTGLTGGTSYTFTATATNANGTSSASSNSGAATPFTATGGTIGTYTGFRVHTFTGTSAFTLTGNSATVDYLVVAGGGGGGRGCCGGAAGGGGAGGMLQASNYSISPATHTITIGGGGAGNTGSTGGNGVASSIGSLISSTGGGGGGRAGLTGNNGGSGGGGGQSNAAGTGIAGQGNSGGTSVAGYSGGGGGGAGAAGSGPKGGDGTSNNIRTGSSEFYGGGGGAGNHNSEPRNNNGGIGGGGNGGDGFYGNGRANISAGTANTGGGGGGAVEENGDYNGEPGGSGIVVIRYAV